jgi:PelA/Pel-15E family pectate lyase
MNAPRTIILACTAALIASPAKLSADDDSQTLRDRAIATMRKAATFYREQVATHGGYVYHYTLDLKRRWGEGEATRDQIWVQPPGTPTVGMACLRAWEATGDRYYLDAARAAAEALCYGQLKSGGWRNCIDFNPVGRRVALYRNGRGRGSNHSSLDDDQTQSAIRLLVRADRALGFKHERIHEAARFALDALLSAQFANGGFPQVWTGPVASQPIVKADYPEYNWRTEGRVKNYWDRYTLNDHLARDVAATLIDAHRVYEDERYLKALGRLGDFLILAQMPAPQPAWAQQYNYRMKPIWARRFEPPAVVSSESQTAIEALMMIHRATGDRKYLEPIPRALAWLKRSKLPDGRLARYYELRTNKPLYMFRRGRQYTLTYDDSDLPDHYAFKISSRVDKLEAEYKELKRGGDRAARRPRVADLARSAREIIAALDEKGRWISVTKDGRLPGGTRLPRGTPHLSSATFSRNLERLSEYVLMMRDRTNPQQSETR